jgi:hypothetical protein
MIEHCIRDEEPQRGDDLGDLDLVSHESARFRFALSVVARAIYVSSGPKIRRNGGAC